MKELIQQSASDILADIDLSLEEIGGIHIEDSLLDKGDDWEEEQLAWSERISPSELLLEEDEFPCDTYDTYDLYGL